MTTKWTKGEWQIDRTGKYYKPCVRMNGVIVAQLADNSAGLVREYDQERVKAEDEANAQLIASAPALYEALVATLKAYNQLMPGFARIAVQDYANLNEAPILAERALRAARGENND